MIHMLKHNNHLKHNNTKLIKDTVRGIGTKRSMTASKMTVSHVKNNNIIVARFNIHS